MSKQENKNKNFILGQKQSMTKVFNAKGEAVPVTIVMAGPCRVIQVKNDNKEEYRAVQLGFGKKNKLTKSLLGHMKGMPNFRYIREFKYKIGELPAGLEKGKEIKVDTFSVGERVKVIGIGKGKGFQGVVKRHGFHGSPASHGHKDQLRMPGSIGATDAARVFKGTKMGGRMGGRQVTVSNLEIVKIDVDNNLLYLKGAVPGVRKGFLKIEGSGELKFDNASKTETSDKGQQTKGERQEIENTKFSVSQGEAGQEVKTDNGQDASKKRQDTKNKNTDKTR